MASEILIDLVGLVATPTSSTFEDSLIHEKSFPYSDDSDLSEDEFSSDKAPRLSGYIPVFLGTPMALRQKLKKAAKKLKKAGPVAEYDISDKHSSWSTYQSSVYHRDSSDYQGCSESRYEDQSHKMRINDAILPTPTYQERSKPPSVTPFIFHKESKAAPKSVVDERCCFCEESMKHLLDNERPLVLSCSHLVHYECLAQLIDTRKLNGSDVTVCFPECPNCGECAKPTDEFYLQEMINSRLCIANGVLPISNANLEYQRPGPRSGRRVSTDTMPTDHPTPSTALPTIVESGMIDDSPIPYTPINPPSLSYFESSPESAASAYALSLSSSDERPINTPISPSHFSTSPLVYPGSQQLFGGHLHNNSANSSPTMAQLAQMPLSERRKYKTNAGSLNKYHPTLTLASTFQQKY